MRKKKKLSKPYKKSKSRTKNNKGSKRQVLSRLQKKTARKKPVSKSRRRTTRAASLRFTRKITTKLQGYVNETSYFRATKGLKGYATKKRVIEVVKTLSKKARKKNRASGQLDAYEAALQVDYTNKKGKRARKWIAAVGINDDEIIRQFNESELLKDFTYKQYKDDGTEITHTLATGFKITGFSLQKTTKIE